MVGLPSFNSSLSRFFFIHSLLKSGVLVSPQAGLANHSLQYFNLKLRRLAEINDNPLFIFHPLAGGRHLTGNLVGDDHHPVFIGVNQISVIYDQSPDLYRYAGIHKVDIGVGRDHTLFALIEGSVKFEPATKDRKKVSVYSA